MSDEGEVFSQQEINVLASEFHLPPRQTEIVHLLLGGLGDKQIALRLGIAMPTVRTHMGRLFTKMGAQDRSEVLIRIFREFRKKCLEVDCPRRKNNN